MKRKNYWFLFAILLLSLTSLSPGNDFTHNPRRDLPGDEPVPPRQQPETVEDNLGPIQVGVSLSHDEWEQLSELNDTFIETTGAEVELVPLDPEDLTIEAFMSNRALNEGPDVYLMDSHFIKTLAKNGYLLPADAFQGIVTDGEILNGLMPPLAWNGYHWGMPFDINPYMLVWEPDKLPDAMPLPDERKAWQELHDKVELPVFFMNAEDPYAFGAVVQLLDGEPGRPDAEVLNWLSDREGTWVLLERDTEMDANEPPDDAAQLEALVEITAYSEVRNRQQEGIDTALILNSHAEQPVIHTRSFAIAAHTASPSLSRKWITYMTSKESQRAWTAAAGTLPVVSELYDPGAVRTDPWRLHMHNLLEQKEAAALDFGREGSFPDYAKSVSQLLMGEMDAEQFTERYSDEQP
ncbi:MULTISPECIES: extracellular solute-binding protein [Paenibacillus]|uniref:Extracellular solute-binding protein n=1 Tax=Paenibacillus campinasensis TaxID=66347 RepID=A0A268F4Q8_9BACL|nr:MULTISPECIES: extracellular solute-binding protein [Paenibacillus]PAD80355.1 hypothetical protein CHH67_01215 [Paenibacillus campinasensis]PAK55338.1 hypothetical protein CHH75_03535 [Paenibacillus sp. 7541]